jgi:hypothetical protein
MNDAHPQDNNSTADLANIDFIFVDPFPQTTRESQDISVLPPRKRRILSGNKCRILPNQAQSKSIAAVLKALSGSAMVEHRQNVEQLFRP